MNPVTVGMTVRSLDDRTIGVVTGVHTCCVRFSLKDLHTSACATWEGIFNSEAPVVSLMYVAGEPHRYSCPAHVDRAAPADASSGWAIGLGPGNSLRVLAVRPRTLRLDYSWRKTPPLRLDPFAVATARTSA